ncbi:MAG: hypothetical protein SVT56_03315 [Chloroflexota bacterium]|jgi:hypothetical protein|nr:hypothetical protein [Chloroflexota bacterium]
MKIVQFKPDDRRSRRAFINFPFKLYENTPQWVPHFRTEMRKIFKSNFSFYNYGEAGFFLAIDENGETQGRLAVANNHRYNNFHNTKTAFFYYFETVEDQAVADGLFSKAFEWAKEQGLSHILGPKGFTVLNGFGMLIKGFEHQPAFNQPYNPSYYPQMVEALGFTKVKDIYTGRINRETEIPEKFAKAAHLVEERVGFKAPKITTKAELREVIDDFKNLYNESLAEPAGNPPLTDEDMDTMVSQLLWIADPRLVKLIYKDEQPVGWILGYPDIGNALQRTKGRLFPFGWLQVLLESKRSHCIDLNGIGIIEDYQRLGGTAVLYNEIYKSVKDIEQYEYADLLQMREENINIFLEVANLDIDFHKTHRLYEKNL